MRRDELKQPLRQRGLGTRLWAGRPGLLAVCYVAIAVGFGGAGYWAVKQPMPFAGEPIVVVSIPPAREVVHTASTDRAAEPEAEVAETPVPDVEQVGEPQVAFQEPVRSDTYQQDNAIVVSPRRPLAAAPQMKVTEVGSYGQLPRISKAGEKPSRVYERPTSLNVIHSDSPKIAILLGGMGLNEKLTAQAVKEDRKSTRLNSSHSTLSRMPSSA